MYPLVIVLGVAAEYLMNLGLTHISTHEHHLLDYGTAALQEISDLRIIGTAAHKAGDKPLGDAAADPERQIVQRARGDHPGQRGHAGREGAFPDVGAVLGGDEVHGAVVDHQRADPADLDEAALMMKWRSSL